jgi:methionyl-tRNA synthetase
MKDQITFDDFQKLDIRIGTVVKAEVPEWSHWVTKLTVDFGPPATPERSDGGRGEQIGEKTIFSGIMKFYAPEDLIGKQFPFVVNLKPKKIGSEGDYSQGMMLAADLSKAPDDEDSKPVLFSLWEKVPNGTKVS